MQKQFEYHALNDLGNQVLKDMSKAFDEFEQRIDSDFLKSQGKDKYSHGLMLDALELAWLHASKAVTARPDVKA